MVTLTCQVTNDLTIRKYRAPGGAEIRIEYALGTVSASAKGLSLHDMTEFLTKYEAFRDARNEIPMNIIVGE